MLYRGSAILFAAAALLAGCGSSKSSSSSGAAKSTETVLLQGIIDSDAYSNYLFGGVGQTLAGEKAIASQMRNAIYGVDLRVRKIAAPATARTAQANYLTAGGALVAQLDRLQGVQSMQSLKSIMTSSLVPAVTKYEQAERPLRLALKVPQPHWLKSQPAGSIIYQDSLSAPHDHIKWTLGSNVRYANGGLQVSTVKENGLTGASSPYNFDSRHVTLQVDAKVLRGDPYVGVLCPPPTGSGDHYLLGQIGPGATYSFGLFSINGASRLLRNTTPTRLVKVGATNRIRVDCDQFSPGITTLRLYVNGKFVDWASAPVALTPNREGGVTVVSSGKPASVVFNNWTVAKLSGTPL